MGGTGSEEGNVESWKRGMERGQVEENLELRKSGRGLPVAACEIANRQSKIENHRIGLWTVTSLVPSGKVASTWTSWIISGTPSMTWSRVRSVVP